jgi:hypothetical protein
MKALLLLITISLALTSCGPKEVPVEPTYSVFCQPGIFFPAATKVNYQGSFIVFESEGKETAITGDICVVQAN